MINMYSLKNTSLYAFLYSFAESFASIIYTRLLKPLFQMSSNGDITDNVIKLAVALIVIASILPTAIMQLTEANTTGWATEVTSMFDLLPLMGVLAVIVLIVYSYITKD